MPASPLGSAPSCPCCNFVSGGGLFLPWNEEGGSNDDVGGSTSQDLSLSAHVIAPREAWDRILALHRDTNESHRNILLVDSHGHPHLQREVQYSHDDDDLALANAWVISLTCAVSPADWKDALEYASQSPHILPALGIHPWYLGDIMIDDIENPDNCADIHIEKYISWDWLTDLETHLSEHPRLLVGEIGLCKMARFVREFPKDKGGKAAALQLQKLVFSRQMELAARYSRPVTVHCVNAHGIFMEVLWEILRKMKDSSAEGGDEKDERKRCRNAFPPAIAMHSFTGTAHHVDEIMAFERALLRPEELADAGGKRRRQIQIQQRHESLIENSDTLRKNAEKDVMFYFGFSHSVNHLMCTSEKARKRGMDAVRSVPKDRLLVESDVHASVDVTLGTAGACAYAAHVRGVSIEDVAKLSVKNGLRFLSSLGSIPSS
ncbi:hypothetical protein ACHAW5_004857 [Stephanodiscus triporus]|uniref:TatD related DNase n=1 Tax=Stephanodiscus triporus TaxID=2934178 RepID=A0ABD3NGD9_9STRA